MAYNCLGVDLQLLKKDMNQAIECHNKHATLSDNHGKFVANINLGLIYDDTNEHSKAIVNYQLALKYAILLASPVGQVLALGNLSEHKQ